MKLKWGLIKKIEIREIKRNNQPIFTLNLQIFIKANMLTLIKNKHKLSLPINEDQKWRDGENNIM